MPAFEGSGCFQHFLGSDQGFRWPVKMSLWELWFPLKSRCVIRWMMMVSPSLFYLHSLLTTWKFSLNWREAQNRAKLVTAHSFPGRVAWALVLHCCMDIMEFPPARFVSGRQADNTTLLAQVTSSVAVGYWISSLKTGCWKTLGLCADGRYPRKSTVWGKCAICLVIPAHNGVSL